MNLDIPFTKEIIFKSKIAEIVSISLEEDISINEGELLGDFIVSGEYKNLDINVDSMPFNHVIPFKVDLNQDIDLNTLKYKINDFTYDVDEDILKVNILFHVEGDIITKNIEEKFIKPEEDIKDEDINIKVEEVKEDNTNSRQVLINNDLENDYITYHVHTVKLSETIDIIANNYKLSKEDILKLNDISDITVGDKILIPLNEIKE